MLFSIPDKPPDSEKSNHFVIIIAYVYCACNMNHSSEIRKMISSKRVACEYKFIMYIVYMILRDIKLSAFFSDFKHQTEKLYLYNVACE